MKDLTPVGLSKDGKRLILLSATGEEFAVAFDHKLRAALRGNDLRLGQLEMKMDSSLRPRDIQTRIRSGETPEAVATAAQTTIEKIMIYAGPVLAERAHVATGALTSSVRRKSAESSSAARTLGEAALGHLRELGLHAEDVEWDAWRRDDGRWSLVADYDSAGRSHHATFTYDQPGRYVVADNDEARFLTGELRRKETTEPSGPKATGGRRLSAVPNQDELPLGDDAIEMVSGPSPTEGAEETEGTEGTVDLTATAEAIRGSAADQHLVELGETPEETDGEIAFDAPAEPARSDESVADEVVEEVEVVEEEKPKKKGRSSVPSWDEIMFGGGKAE